MLTVVFYVGCLVCSEKSKEKKQHNLQEILEDDQESSSSSHGSENDTEKGGKLQPPKNTGERLMSTALFANCGNFIGQLNMMHGNNVKATVPTMKMPPLQPTTLLEVGAEAQDRLPSNAGVTADLVNAHFTILSPPSHFPLSQLSTEKSVTLHSRSGKRPTQH